MPNFVTELERRIHYKDDKDRDRVFRGAVQLLPERYWAKYDLSAVRLGWEMALMLQEQERSAAEAKLGLQLNQLKQLAENTTCGACEYEEADGSLFRHCHSCQEKIVLGLWQATHPE